MDAKNPLLVIVDAQNGFVNERSKHVVSAIVALLEEWLQCGRDVIFTRYHNYPGSPYERFIHWSQLQSPPETDIVDELAPYIDRAKTVVDKNTYTLFTDIGSKTVRDGGWSDLLFCGVATESCVMKSAVDAFELGYAPWIITDASASHAGDEVHRAGLLVAARFIGSGQLITSEQAVESFCR